MLTADALLLIRSFPNKLAAYHVPLYPSRRSYSEYVFLLSHSSVSSTPHFLPTVTSISTCESIGCPFLMGNADSVKLFKWLTAFILHRHNLTIGFEHHDHSYKRTKKMRANKPDESGTLYLGTQSFFSSSVFSPNNWSFRRRWLLRSNQEKTRHQSILP